MATSTQLAQTQIVTRDGVVTATVLDRVSPDRVALMLVRGAAAARYGRTTDTTELLDRSIVDLIVLPGTTTATTI